MTGRELAEFNIVHVSDPHFAASSDWRNDITDPSYKKKALFALKNLSSPKGIFRPSSYSKAKALGLLDYLERETYLEDKDILLITGDLAATGKNEDLVVAKEILSGDKNSILSDKVIDVSKSFPVFILPGNHDRFTPPFLLPYCKEFETVFGQAWACGEDVQEVISSEHGINRAIIEKNGEYLIIYALDMSLRNCSESEGVYGCFGQGIVSEDALKKLEGDVVGVKEILPECVIVIATHFPPQHVLVDGGSDIKLINEDLLCECAKNVGASLLLSGHVHRVSDPYIINDTVVFCAGTVCSTDIQISEMNHLYDIKVIVESGNVVNVMYSDVTWQHGSFVKGRSIPIDMAS